MIGIGKVAKQIEEIVSLIEYARESETGSPNLHMRFVGPPGTGMTTVARIIEQILKERGILCTGILRECNGNDPIAK